MQHAVGKHMNSSIPYLPNWSIGEGLFKTRTHELVS